MREVQQVLVVRIRMDGRHPSLLDAEVLMNDLGQRRKTVRRARRVRNDLVLARIVLVVVDAEDDRDVRTLRGSGDDDLLGAGRQVLGGILPLGEEAGRLEHDVDAEVLPRELRRIAHREHLELVAVDRNRVALGFHLRVQVAEHGVVLQQMGERGGVCEIVDRHEVDVPVTERGAHDVAADSPESVDAYFHCHRTSASDRPQLSKTLNSSEPLAEGQTEPLYFVVPKQRSSLHFPAVCISPTAC